MSPSQTIRLNWLFRRRTERIQEPYFRRKNNSEIQLMCSKYVSSTPSWVRLNELKLLFFLTPYF